jgi:hypothetical protein
MNRHRFDLLSAIFGILFIGAALVVLVSGDGVLEWDSRWVWPGVILAAGLVMVASGIGSEHRRIRPRDLLAEITEEEPAPAEE